MKVDFGVGEMGDFGGSSSSEDERLYLDAENSERFEEVLCFKEMGDDGVEAFDFDALSGAGIRMQFWWKVPWTVSVS